MKEQKNAGGKIQVPELEKVPEGFHSAVLEALAEIEQAESGRGVAEGMPKRACGQADGKTRRTPAGRRAFKKGALIPLAAALCLTVGGTVFAAANLYQQRMEAMNQEMLEEFYAQAYVGETFRYSRELTEAEKARFDELNAAYENSGRFPEKSLNYLETAEEYDGKCVGLYAQRSTLFLPEAELSDEELLQIIDFQHKIVYSVSEISEQAEANGGKYPAAAQDIPAADGQQVIAYEGDLEAAYLTAGDGYLYLAGKNEVHRMAQGNGLSELFYEADQKADMAVCALETGTDGSLFVALAPQSGEDTDSTLLHISADGARLWETALENMPGSLAADSQGRVYVQDADGGFSVFGPDGMALCTWSSAVYREAEDLFGEAVEDLDGTAAQSGGAAENLDAASQPADGAAVEQSAYAEPHPVLDAAGADIPYVITASEALCRGRDGSVYLLAESAVCEGVLLRLDPDTGGYALTAEELHPALQAHDRALLRGKNRDFVIWNAEGLYGYTLGSAQAEKILELYEAPLNWEGAACTELEDGRLVFMKAYESAWEGGEGGIAAPVPTSIRFFYVTAEE